MVAKVRCEHCGAECKYPVTKTIDGRALDFCCAGCLQVYELMREEGQPGAVQPDREPGPKQSKAPIADRLSGATLPSKTITLAISGMTCANCVARVEGALRSVHGVLSANVNLAAERAAVEIVPGVVTLADLKRAVVRAGYEVLDRGAS